MKLFQYEQSNAIVILIICFMRLTIYSYLELYNILLYKLLLASIKFRYQIVIEKVRPQDWNSQKDTFLL